MSSGGLPSKPTPWATSTSYPVTSNPWDSTPIRVMPATKYMTPGTDATAEGANALWGEHADRIQALIDGMTSVPLTFQSLVTTLGVSMTSACWDDHAASWVVMGNGAFDQVARATDNGYTWVAGSTSSGITFESGAFDNSGNAVFPSSTTGINDYTASTGLYAKHTGVFTGGVTAPVAVWSQTAALFCVMYRNGASGFQCFTSANRTAWTSRTAALPAAWTAYTGSKNVSMGARAGAIVALYQDVTCQVAYSTNGGVTWTAGSIGTSTNVSVSPPVYDPNNAAWYVSVYDASSHKMEIWQSLDDGATWSMQYSKTSGGICLGMLANVGSLLVGLDVDTIPGALFFSTDQGVTWKRSSARPATTLWSSGSGFMVLDTSGKTSANSVRIGLIGQNY